MGRLATSGNARTRDRLANLAAAAGGFDPASLGTLYAWYDPSDAATLTVTSGRLDQINDKSGNGRNLSSTGGNRPFSGSRTSGGLNVMDFQAGQYTRITGLSFATAAWTVIIHQIHDGGADNQGLLVTHPSSGNDFDNANGFAITPSDTGNIASLVNGGGRLDVGGAGVMTAGTWAWRANSGVGGGYRYHEPGNSTATNTVTSSGTAVGLILGTRFVGGVADTHYFDGAIGEVWVYSVALSNTDMDTAWTQMKAKWGT